MLGLGVTILGVLNQKHHQECDDGGGRVDDELPRVGKVKGWPRHNPKEDSKNGRSECPCAAKQNRRALRKTPKRIAYDAKEIAIMLIIIPFPCCGFLRHVTKSFARDSPFARTTDGSSKGKRQSGLISPLF